MREQALPVSSAEDYSAVVRMMKCCNGKCKVADVEHALNDTCEDSEIRGETEKTLAVS